MFREKYKKVWFLYKKIELWIFEIYKKKWILQRIGEILRTRQHRRLSLIGMGQSARRLQDDCRVAAGGTATRLLQVKRVKTFNFSLTLTVPNVNHCVHTRLVIYDRLFDIKQWSNSAQHGQRYWSEKSQNGALLRLKALINNLIFIWKSR